MQDKCRCWFPVGFIGQSKGIIFFEVHNLADLYEKKGGGLDFGQKIKIFPYFLYQKENLLHTLLGSTFF